LTRGGWHFRPATAAALLGAVDTATFMITRRAKSRARPGRAAGNAGLLILWVTLCVRSHAEADRTLTPTVALATGLLAANLALLGVHVRARVAGPRVYIAPVLAAAALSDVLRRR
jgi:hypothetical protein